MHISAEFFSPGAINSILILTIIKRKLKMRNCFWYSYYKIKNEKKTSHQFNVNLSINQSIKNTEKNNTEPMQASPIPKKETCMDCKDNNKK